MDGVNTPRLTAARTLGLRWIQWQIKMSKLAFTRFHPPGSRSSWSKSAEAIRYAALRR